MITNKLNLKIKKKTLSEEFYGNNDTSKIEFRSLNESEQKIEYEGAIVWNGSEWIAEDDSHSCVKERLKSSMGFCGKVFTSRDYDFFLPFVKQSITGLIVKRIVKSKNDSQTEKSSRTW
jgi:hypothetical protein